jgi:hypothetical protein
MPSSAAAVFCCCFSALLLLHTCWLGEGGNKMCWWLTIFFLCKLVDRCLSSLSLSLILLNNNQFKLNMNAINKNCDIIDRYTWRCLSCVPLPIWATVAPCKFCRWFVLCLTRSGSSISIALTHSSGWSNQWKKQRKNFTSIFPSCYYNHHIATNIYIISYNIWTYI